MSDDPRAGRSEAFGDSSIAGEAPTGFIKPPFGYFGAKQRLAKRIVEMLPRHNAWVEVFCGSAVVTINKPQAPLEVINDLDGNVVNLFTVLRDKSKELCEQVALTPYARAEFELARRGEEVKDPLERARRFLVATMMTVNGTSGSVNNSGFSFSDSYVRGGREARVNRWYQLPERLTRIIERLRSLRIENKDARNVVRQFADRPGTLMYLDPPYLMDREHVYSKDANDEEFHEELLLACLKSRAMIIVSGYENNLYVKHLKRTNGWKVCKIQTKTRGTNGADAARTEVLWTNEAFQKANKSGRIPLRLSATESKEKKLNPVRPRAEGKGVGHDND
jgi:DNA adenine methylase